MARPIRLVILIRNIYFLYYTKNTIYPVLWFRLFHSDFISYCPRLKWTDSIKVKNNVKYQKQYFKVHKY